MDCQQFYSDIFPPESIESCWEDHRPNPILTYCKYLKENGSPAMFHTTVYSDYQNLELVRDNQMALLGMCTYSGAAPTSTGMPEGKGVRQIGKTFIVQVFAQEN